MMDEPFLRMKAARKSSLDCCLMSLRLSPDRGDRSGTVTLRIWKGVFSKNRMSLTFGYRNEEVGLVHSRFFQDIRVVFLAVDHHAVQVVGCVPGDAGVPLHQDHVLLFIGELPGDLEPDGPRSRDHDFHDFLLNTDGPRCQSRNFPGDFPGAWISLEGGCVCSQKWKYREIPEMGLTSGRKCSIM